MGVSDGAPVRPTAPAPEFIREGSVPKPFRPAPRLSRLPPANPYFDSHLIGRSERLLKVGPDDVLIITYNDDTAPDVSAEVAAVIKQKLGCRGVLFLPEGMKVLTQRPSWLLRAWAWLYLFACHFRF